MKSVASKGHFCSLLLSNIIWLPPFLLDTPCRVPSDPLRTPPGPSLSAVLTAVFLIREAHWPLLHVCCLMVPPLRAVLNAARPVRCHRRFAWSRKWLPFFPLVSVLFILDPAVRLQVLGHSLVHGTHLFLVIIYHTSRVDVKLFCSFFQTNPLLCFWRF